MNNKIERILPKLKKLISLSNHSQHRLSCIIMQGNRIISEGFNEVKTHPKSLAGYNMKHAEISAVLNSEQDLRGCTAYVYRERRDGLPGLSKPCRGCEAMLKNAGIKKVIFSSEQGWQELMYA
jgi:deoxycytidylate deaminase